MVGSSDAVITPMNTAWVSIRRNGFAENVWRQGMGDGGWGGEWVNRALVRHGTEGGAVQDANRGLHSEVQAGSLSKLHCHMYIAHKQRDEDEK